MENQNETDIKTGVFTEDGLQNVLALIELLKQIRARLLREGVDINNVEEPIYPKPRKKRQTIIK